MKIYDNIRTTTGNWTVEDIPAIYDNLEFVVLGRGDRASDQDGVECFFNNDTDVTHYFVSRHRAGEIHDSLDYEGAVVGAIPCVTAPANYAGVILVSILSYKLETFYKIARCWSGHRYGAVKMAMWDMCLHWENDAAITELLVRPQNSTGFVAGSRLIVYGTL